MYENRMMTSERRDGHLCGGNCPKCGKPLYYASTLHVHFGILANVEYCGCGFTQPAREEFLPEPTAEDSK